MAENQNVDYSASNITVLEGLEAVRVRPAMYIGDVNERGLHHLVYEVVDNSIDEALAGYCNRIDVSINPDNSITVMDNGRGIPVDMHEKEHRSALEVVMTVLHAGGKFNKNSYKVSGGLHGVGVSCVNALSDHMKVEVYRNGKAYRQEYSKGKPLYPVTEIGPTDKQGTLVEFHPDDTIFTVTEYKYDTLLERMRELSFLNKGIQINICDWRLPEEATIEDAAKLEKPTREDHFYSERGLRDFIAYLDENRERLMPEAIYIEGDRKGIPIEIAMQYNTGFSENLHSYVNNINTHEGGTHLAGFRSGLTRTLKAYADRSGMLQKAKVDRSEGSRRGGRQRDAGELPRRAPQRSTHHSGQSHTRSPRPPSSPQGTRDGATQQRIQLGRHAWQTGRLPKQRSHRMRNFLRRGRFGRWKCQERTRPQVSSRPSLEG